MFYIIIRSLHRRERIYIMNISETPMVNNSLYGYDNVSGDSLPEDHGLYTSEAEEDTFTLPPDQKFILKVNRHYEALRGLGHHHGSESESHYASEPDGHHLATGFNYYSHRSSHRSGSGGFVYAGIAIGAIGVLLIVAFLLYRLMKRFDLYAVTPERMPEVRPECHHLNCGQYCTLARGTSSRSDTTIYNSHQSVHTLTVTSEILPSDSVSNHELRNAHISALDLPPSYMSSVRNSSFSLTSVDDTVPRHSDKYDLPPSYSEAIISMSPNRPSNNN